MEKIIIQKMYYFNIILLIVFLDEFKSETYDWNNYIIGDKIFRPGKRIKSLDGIEKFSYLTEITLPNNLIKELKHFSTFFNVTYLMIYSNQIENIDPIGSLTNLKELYLSDNNIKNISGLKYLVNLNIIDF